MRCIKTSSGVKNYIALFFGVAALSTSAIFVKLSTAPSPVTAFYRLLFTALALLPFLVFSERNRREFASFDRRQVSSIVLSGLLLAVHYTMWFESLRFTSVSSSTVLVSMQPLFSLLWGFLFLGEKVRPSAVAGCLIAIAGSAVIGWGDFAVSSAAFLLVYALVSKNPLSGFPALTWCSFLGLAFLSTIDDGFHGDSRGAGGNVHPGVSYSERNYCAQAVCGDCHYYAWIVFVFFLSAGKRAGALISSRR